ncbi:hypothetical protein D3C81_493000 [compost metagenome]
MVGLIRWRKRYGTASLRLEPLYRLILKITCSLHPGHKGKRVNGYTCTSFRYEQCKDTILVGNCCGHSKLFQLFIVIKIFLGFGLQCSRVITGCIRNRNRVADQSRCFFHSQLIRAQFTSFSQCLHQCHIGECYFKVRYGTRVCSIQLNFCILEEFWGIIRRTTHRCPGRTAIR